MSARVPEFENGLPADRLAALGITLPKVTVPLAAYMPAERTGARLPSLSGLSQYGASGLDLGSETAAPLVKVGAVVVLRHPRVAAWAVSDLAVTAVAIGGGVALGRVLSLRPRVTAILLALWSIADIAQIVLISGGVAGWIGRCRARLAGLCRAPDSGSGGHYDIGPLGLLLFTAIGERWRRRRGSPVQSAGPA